MLHTSTYNYCIVDEKHFLELHIHKKNPTFRWDLQFAKSNYSK